MNENKTHITCFGELLLRLSPQLNGAWIRNQQLAVFIGGAELNVATALAHWGLPVSYCTQLPDHYLSHEIVDYLNTLQIKTTDIQYGGDRMGTYYLPSGTDIKQGGVIYDRAYSAFWNLKVQDLDWSTLLQHSSRFHFSAISPALNASVADVCLEAVQTAHALGIPVSVDLNDRAKLWQYTRDKPGVMKRYLSYCKVVMGNLWSVASLLDIQHGLPDQATYANEQLVDASRRVMNAIQTQWPEVETMAFTFRMADRYFSVLQHQQRFVSSSVYDMKSVQNQVGSGDCYMAALLYQLVQGGDPTAVIEFATSAARGKMNEAGDATRQSVQEIETRIKSNQVHQHG